MSIAIGHVGIPAADPWASARFLGEILAEGETTPEGPDGEMVSLSVGDGSLTHFGLIVGMISETSGSQNMRMTPSARRHGLPAR